MDLAAPTATARPRRKNPATSAGPLRALRLLVIYGFALFCLIPLLWLVLAPTKSDSQITDGFPLSFGTLERALQAWQHLADYQDGVIFLWIGNSLLYAASSIVISVVTSLMAGYALALTRFPGRKAILYLTLIAMVVPAAALVLPLFLGMNALGLTDTHLSVILVASFYPFGTYLAFVYFATSLPVQILEAARIDGCSETRSFLSIALPLAKPIIGLIVFFSFVANWNNYFMPYILLVSEEKYNLPVGLGALIASTPALHPERGASNIPITRPEVALAGVLVVVPIALLFIFFQRYLTRGILEGATKG